MLLKSPMLSALVAGLALVGCLSPSTPKVTNWDDTAVVEQFMQGCLGSSPDERRRQICQCALGKLKKGFPDADKITNNDSEAAGAGCAKEIPP